MNGPKQPYVGVAMYGVAPTYDPVPIPDAQPLLPWSPLMPLPTTPAEALDIAIRLGRAEKEIEQLKATNAALVEENARLKAQIEPKNDPCISG